MGEGPPACHRDDINREHEHAKEDDNQDRTTATQQTVKIAKGRSTTQDLGGDLWFCSNAKQKKFGDDQVVMMRQTEEGQPVGDATEQPIGSIQPLPHFGQHPSTGRRPASRPEGFGPRCAS